MENAELFSPSVPLDCQRSICTAPWSKYQRLRSWIGSWRDGWCMEPLFSLNSSLSEIKTALQTIQSAHKPPNGDDDIMWILSKDDFSIETIFTLISKKSHYHIPEKQCEKCQKSGNGGEFIFPFFLSFNDIVLYV